MINTPRKQTRFCIMLVSLLTGGLIAPLASADIVKVQYAISAFDFLNSNNQSPMSPTSNQIAGTVTFTYNTAVFQQLEIVPDAVTGFSMTDNDGHIINYDTQNTGINTLTSVTGGGHRFVYGGTQSSVAFMAGISEDIRVQFDVSSIDYTVTNVSDEFRFVTTTDAFYTAQNNSVILQSVEVLPDSDADGVHDAIDNCQLVENLDQRDTNGDNIGNACDPDFNQDCVVNFADLAIFGNNFLLTGDLDTDMNGDGETNFIDLSVLTGLIFSSPGPSGLSNLCNL